MPLADLARRLQAGAQGPSPTYTNRNLTRQSMPTDDVVVESAAPRITRRAPTSMAGLEPGDPDFDWGRYDEWKASRVDPVAAARPSVNRMEEEQRLRATNIATEQQRKLQTGEIPSDGMTPGMVGREILASATPTKMALLASLLVPGGPLAAGAAGAFGHVAGDIAQRQATSMGAETAAPSEGLLDEATNASLAGLYTATGAKGFGLGRQGFSKAGQMLRGGGVNRALDVAGALPGKVGLAARVARRFTGKGSAASTPAAPASTPPPVEVPAMPSAPSRAGVEIPTGEHFQRAGNPNQILSTARDVMGETGESLTRVLKGKGGKTGFVQSPASLRALQSLAKSGEGFKALRANEGRALAELSTPGARAYLETQFAKNNPIARRILGRQVGG